MAKKQSVWLWVSAISTYLFLYLPLVIVVVFSFNDSKLNAECCLIYTSDAADE